LNLCRNFLLKQFRALVEILDLKFVVVASLFGHDDWFRTGLAIR
jgi:hypothetical protein